MLEYVIIRHGKGLAVKREHFQEHVVNSESIPAPQLLLVPEALESVAGILVELLVGLGSILYEHHVQPIVRSGKPSNVIAYELKMYHQSCVKKELI